MRRLPLLFRLRVVFSFSDIQKLLNVQNSLGTRQQAPFSKDNEKPAWKVYYKQVDFTAGVPRIPFSYWNILIFIRTIYIQVIIKLLE